MKSRAAEVMLVTDGALAAIAAFDAEVGCDQGPSDPCGAMQDAALVPALAGLGKQPRPWPTGTLMTQATGFSPDGDVRCSYRAMAYAGAGGDAWGYIGVCDLDADAAWWATTGFIWTASVNNADHQRFLASETGSCFQSGLPYTAANSLVCPLTDDVW